MTRSARTILERWGVTRFLKDSADRRQRGINRLNVADAVQHCSFPDSNGVDRGGRSIIQQKHLTEREIDRLGLSPDYGLVFASSLADASPTTSREGESPE